MKYFNGFLKWLFRAAVVVVVIILVLSAVGYFFRSNQPPSIEKAQWGIQTYTNDKFRVPSRYYYAEGVEYKQGILTTNGSWWSLDGKKYKKHKEVKQFPESEYGKVLLVKRG